MNRTFAAPAIAKPKDEDQNERPPKDCPEENQELNAESHPVRLEICLPRYLVTWLHTQDNPLSKVIQDAITFRKEYKI